MASKRQQRPGQEGASLIVVLVIAGIVAVIAAAASNLSVNSAHANSSLVMAADRTALTQTISALVDCGQTLQAYTPPSSCPAYIPLYDQNGKLVVAGTANGTKFGRWSLRATCSPAGITVQSALLSTGNTFAKDPMTGKTLDWSYPQNTLLPAQSGLCAAAFNPALSTAPIFGGYIYRCPYNSDGKGGVVTASYPSARTDTSMPANIYTGTYNCPANFVPRYAWKYMSANCGQNTYCTCGFVAANPKKNACAIANTGLGVTVGGSSTGIVGCGQIQFMCVRNADGTPVASDGTGLD